MAFVSLEDDTGKIEMVVFPKTFQQVEQILQENKAIYVEGKMNERDGEKSIIADVISLDAPNNTVKYDFIINVPKNTSQTQLVSLNRLLKNNQNGHRGLIILANGKNIPLSYGVNYNSDLQVKINKILNIT